ncbi:Emopamil-binding protein [Parachaetomium inaequale]|uniref:Emopamil-binding protein n=1 Tax=Parachaetomium inaequale TaxID=2588326 RepID=A0AAN6PCB9_9PEZI|nr:Emopamil-binding protein [Parachaetomium inaequale]
MSVPTSPNASMAGHPYYPPDLVLPGFMPNKTAVPILLMSFAGAAGFVFWTTSVLARTVQPGISKGKLLTAMWFMLCGCIHLFFEGYFARHNGAMPARIDLFGQLWKEYAKSDRRYLTRDSFVVCMETVTAVAWGPLSFVVGWFVIKDSPLRHPLQIILSLGQLYGDVLYYATFFFDESVYGAVYCRPESFYFWAYFVLLNGFWIVIPAWLVIQSTIESTKAFHFAQETAKQRSPK